MHCLNNFKPGSLLKRIALDVIIRDLNYPEIYHLRKAFTRIDKTNLGYIRTEDLIDASISSKAKLSEADVVDIIKNVGSDFHSISYSEFLAAVLSYAQVMNENTLKETFDQFDLNESGFINELNFIETLKRKGKTVDISQVKSMINKIGKATKGGINYQEFKAEIID